METLDSYRKRWFTHAREIDGKLDTLGPLRLPEQMALRLMWGYETGQVSFSEEDAGRAARVLYAKLTNELFAFVGCARIGSLVGAWHHVRAIIEIRATVHHLWLAAPKEADARVTRYWTFVDAVGWLRMQEDRNTLRETSDPKKRALLEWRIALSERAARSHGKDFSPERIAEWKKVFGPNIETSPQTVRWHPRQHQISKMVEDCDETGGARRDYWVASQATHTSPIGGRIASGEVRLIGYDLDMLPMAVDAAMAHTMFAVNTIDSALSTKIRALIDPDMQEFARVRGL